MNELEYFKNSVDEYNKKMKDTNKPKNILISVIISISLCLAIIITIKFL